jgi:hypothetical protein
VNSLARVPANRSADGIVPITNWLGVNENPDGDNSLQIGEAAAMTNFKITSNRKLQKRPGTQNVAGLLSAYSIDTDTETTTVVTDTNTATSTFTVYPNISVTSGGILSVSGTPVTVNSSNIGIYDNHYWADGNGKYYLVGDFTYHAAAGTPVTGGGVNISATEILIVTRNTTTNNVMYPAIKVQAGALYLDGTPASTQDPREYSVTHPYINYDGNIYQISHIDYGYYIYIDGYLYPGFRIYGYAVTYAADDTYTWDFYEVTSTTVSTDTAVKGIWSGRVGASEYIVAACNGRLWSLSEIDGVWTKTEIGNITTTGDRVHMFGFDSKLYMLNGSQYLVWDGITLSTVVGYRPLTYVATPPAGGGTALERINMLNGQRRVRFSSTAGTTFQLPETGLASIDYVKYVSTGAAIATTTLNLATGLVTTSAATTSGTSNIEIGYTASTTYRSQIEAMTLSELYNGANDNRVFVYGDGSNKAFYSGLDGNGQPTAEYFPDLNVVHVGEANTPITSMVRHYDRLLAFKSDSAYSIRYDAVQLVSGTVTAGFYTLPIHKGLGCAGYGQAVVVGNHPRTLDGRSIYEWVATTSSGNITSDQRNAQSVSQKVDTTIRSMTLENAFTFMDKINHEFYVVENGVAIIQNTENGAWYIYRNFPAVCMIVYKDELYFGTADGYIRHVSRDYRHDVGEAITCYWESGSMSFGKEFMRKYTDKLYINLSPEQYSEVYVTLQSDKQNDYTEEEILSSFSAVASGIFDFADLNFEHFTFNLNDKPQIQSKKIKVKNYAFLKLLLMTATNDTTCTVLGVDIKVRETGMVK